MKYIIADNTSPIQYLVCGKLVSTDVFVHIKRIPDYFVFIVVNEGTLYITHDNQKYTLHANDTILLFPGTEHYGHKATEGNLSYYWVHFKFTDSNYVVCMENELKKQVDFWNANPETPHILRNYIIPQAYKLTSDNRINLLFVQMLDTAKRDNFYITQRMHYSISLLILELTEEFLSRNHTLLTEIPPHLSEIIDWVRANYEKNITVEELSRQFNYNPIYLSSLFKKYTGYPVIPYINRFRIAVSKNLLMNRTTKIYTISKMCGFTDEKHYMKLFKRYEGITPTQYRDAFYHKFINSK